MMPLKVIIVGGGIGGLAAALAIGRQGHEVEIFERSGFSNEIGAALHLAPYAIRLLKHWGLDLNSLRARPCSQWRYMDYNRKLINVRFDLEEKKRELCVDEDELMIHRVDIHRTLREAALELDNVKLFLSSDVQSVDPETATITLINGQTHSGDVVLGADGVHSKTIYAHTPDIGEPRDVGVSMYRWMVSIPMALNNQAIKAFLESYPYKSVHNTYFAAHGSARMLHMYPCRNATLMNMASFQYVSEEKKPLDSDYNTPGTVQEILDLFEGWPEYFQTLFHLAEDVKHWKLISRRPLKSFTKGRLALVGDAAHAMMPTHGAGAAQAIEDAGALSVLLDQTANRENVLERLKLYSEVRYRRAITVKCASEVLGRDSPARRQKCLELLQPLVDDPVIPEDIEAFLWRGDVIKEAKEALAGAEARSNGHV